MILSKDDANLFFELFFPLLNFVNKKYKINTSVGKICFGKSIDFRDAKEIADHIWSDVGIIDEYLSKKKLSDENKKIIEDWKRRISGKFIVERHLKKGSVLISAEDETVYLVNGIFSSWDEMLCGRPLPVVVEVVLLPFKNVIISDGLVVVSNLTFGRNMSESFKEIYLTAKKNGEIHKTI